jgi:hypothetical protein
LGASQKHIALSILSNHPVGWLAGWLAGTKWDGSPFWKGWREKGIKEEEEEERWKEGRRKRKRTGERGRV